MKILVVEDEVKTAKFLKRGLNEAGFVVDVAKTASGEWIVVELNDGQQSGLSCCNPIELYSNISRVLTLHR